jgi:hypothetical protein
VSGPAAPSVRNGARPASLVVGGSAIIQYSTQALALANLVSATASALPTPVQLVTLADCAQVPSGSGNCP